MEFEKNAKKNKKSGFSRKKIFEEFGVVNLRRKMIG